MHFHFAVHTVIDETHKACVGITVHKRWDRLLKSLRKRVDLFFLGSGLVIMTGSYKSSKDGQRLINNDKIYSI